MGVRGQNYLSEIASRIRQVAEQSSPLPDEEDINALFYSYAVLALAKGESVEAADVHNAWVAWMLPREPEHDALVPYADLDKATADMDEPFAEAVRCVARELRGD